MIALAFVLPHAGRCAFAAQGEASAKKAPLLAPITRAFPPWYQRLVYFTDWPDVSALPEVREVGYSPYAPETLLKEILKDDVLQKGWQGGMIRAPGWIPVLAGVTHNRLDAYLWRQSFQGGRLHICDTRPFLTVAFWLEGGSSTFTEKPRESLERLTVDLLKLQLPEGYQLQFDEVTGLAKGHALYNVAQTGGAATGINPEKTDVSSFSLSWMLGEQIVIYEFQKFCVPGCDLHPAFPLFRIAGAEQSEVEDAIEYFDGLKTPVPADIPKLARILRSLPEIDPRDQRDHPYELKLLSKAKYTGYDKLIAAVKTVTMAEDVSSIRQALDALPKEEDLHGKAREIQRTANEVLRKIATLEGKQVPREMADTAKTPQFDAEAMEQVVKSMPEHEGRRFCLEEAEKLADSPDAEPEKLIFLMRGLRQDYDPPEVRVLRKILRKTRNEKVRVACLRALSKWITDASEIREDVLGILEGRLQDESARVRAAAVRALGHSGEVRYVARLVPALDDADSGVRHQAAEAICTLLGWEPRRVWQEEEEFDAWLGKFKAILPPVLEALHELEEATHKGP